MFKFFIFRVPSINEWFLRFLVTLLLQWSSPTRSSFVFVFLFFFLRVIFLNIGVSSWLKFSLWSGYHILFWGLYLFIHTEFKRFFIFFFSFRVIYFDIIYDLLFLLIWVQLKLELVPKKLKENIIFQNRSEMEFDLPNKRTVWLTGVTRHFVSPKKSY